MSSASDADGHRIASEYPLMRRWQYHPEYHEPGPGERGTWTGVTSLAASGQPQGPTQSRREPLTYAGLPQMLVRRSR
jgi:hypothetical protein